jgi:hypothetical protein
MKSKRRSTNEMEFQGQVVTWLNENISKHSGMGLDRATQEKPRSSSGKRNDLVVWQSRVSLIAFLSFELKTPDTPISDAVFLADAIEKAQQWGSPYFVIWNMQEAELYPTPLVGSTVTPSDRLHHWPPSTGCDSLEDWLKPEVGARLKHQADEILDKAWDKSIRKGGIGVVIDAEIFVTRLSTAIHGLQIVSGHPLHILGKFLGGKKALDDSSSAFLQGRVRGPGCWRSSRPGSEMWVSWLL